MLRVPEIVALYPEVYDFGTVFQAETLSYPFSLSNQSAAVLRVIRIETTCSCSTIAETLVGRTIPPRGSLTIPVEYAVGDREGPVSSFVSIFVAATNSMNHIYELQAHMKGTALPEFVIEPPMLDFGSLKPGERSAKTITFLPKQAKTLKIFPTAPIVNAFSISVQQTKSDHNYAPSTAVITFQAPTNAIQLQTLSADVDFATSSTRRPNASIYVVGRVVPDVQINPSMIIVPSPGLNNGECTELTLRTSQSSRVVRLGCTSEATHAPASIGASNHSPPLGTWNTLHHLRIPNSSLTKAIGVGVELEVHSAADRIEARSVYVPMKSLNATKYKQ
jgi:hypothetical protein